MNHGTKRLASLAFISLLCAALPPALAAEVRLPAVIGDHMVIQQAQPVTVWGWAGKTEKVTVRLAGQERQVRASADGTWRAVFDPLKAGGAALEMTVRGEKGPDITVKDILVGEVWLCSGQSNMEWAMEWLPNPNPEIMRADHPNLRLFLIPKKTADRPKDDVETKWAPCSPSSVRPFSAVAYFYGLELHARLGVPVGLIESAWGGTDIEPWTPPAGFAAVPETKPLLEKQLAKYEDYRKAMEKELPAWEAWARDAQKALKAKLDIPPEPKSEFPSNPFDNPQAPTTLYNAMIHALTPFAIRGAIWYQGENNRNDVLFYEKKMEALIKGWREIWKLGDFPFYYVQLAPYNYPYNRETPAGEVPDFLRLPLIWEAQANILRMPNTGMAVVTDIANLNDIHPSNKKDVGYRLALWARANAYGEKGIVNSGPLYKSMTVEGDKAKIAFNYVGGGLMTNDGQQLKWFEVSGDDHIFYKAEAEIAGDMVVVHSPRVASPKAVRFGWQQLAVPNLINKEGLPASPFRTDRW
ncbi:MAG: sialate O-acetylesterase [Candidatus Aminicenantales bacterium]